MKTGWILSILDTHGNDRALKFVKGDRDRAESKRVEYQTRYNSLEESRYQVRLESQYSESDIKGDLRFRCLLRQGYTPRDLANDLDSDIFMRKPKNGFHRFEMDADEFDKCKSALDELDPVIEYELESHQGR